MSEAQVKQVEPLLVGADAAGRILGISRRHFATMESDGKIGPMPISFGRRKVWKLSELKLWVDGDCPRRDSAEWKQIREEGRKCT